MTEKPLFSVLAAAGSILVGVAAVALTAFLHKIDLRENQQNVFDLGTLSSVKDIPRLSELLQNRGHLEDAVLSWLASNHSEVDELHRNSRSNLLAWIRQTQSGDGAGIRMNDEIQGRLSGKQSSRGIGNKIPFYLFEVVLRHPPDAPSASLEAEDRSVYQFVSHLDELTNATKINVMTNVIITNISKLAHGSFNLLKAQSSGNSVILSLAENSSVQAQRSAREQNVAIPGELAVIEGPTFLELLTIGNPSRRALAELAGKPDRPREVAARYGSLSLEQAQSFAAGAVAENFRAMSIAGFSFSPLRVPDAVFWLSAIALASTLVVFYAAASRGLILRPGESDSAFAIIWCYSWSRFTFWTLLPLLCLVFAPPNAAGGNGGNPLFWIYVLAIALLGITCTRKSAAVFK